MVELETGTRLRVSPASNEASGASSLGTTHQNGEYLLIESEQIASSRGMSILGRGLHAWALLLLSAEAQLRRTRTGAPSPAITAHRATSLPARGRSNEPDRQFYRWAGEAMQMRHQITSILLGTTPVRGTSFGVDFSSTHLGSASPIPSERRGRRSQTPTQIRNGPLNAAVRPQSPGVPHENWLCESGLVLIRCSTVHLSDPAI